MKKSPSTSSLSATDEPTQLPGDFPSSTSTSSWIDLQFRRELGAGWFIEREGTVATGSGDTLLVWLAT